MRTLVVSDLHLGARTGRDLLRRPETRAGLLEELPSVDRLVLLGDLLELRQGPVRDALHTARPVLAEIGDALGANSQVVIVPGNHDHHLLSPWLERRAHRGPPPPLGFEADVDWRSGEALATVVRSLGPAEVRVRYPGVWLRDEVYALHGHYGDRHTTVPTFERLGAGAMARILREAPAGPERAEDYEAILGPIYAWIHAVAQSAPTDAGRGSDGTSARAWQMLADRGRGRGLRRRGLIAAVPAVIAGLNRAQLGPLRPDLSGAELRRAALRACGEVLVRLGIEAVDVIFGHTHRAGPLPGDERSEWHAPGGSRLLNTGCWVHEPGFIGGRPQQSPYRAGFAALLGPEGPPKLVNLLDGR